MKHVKTGQQGQDCDQGLCGKLCKKATGTSQESHYDRRSTTSTSPPSPLPRGHGQGLRKLLNIFTFKIHVISARSQFIIVPYICSNSALECIIVLKLNFVLNEFSSILALGSVMERV